MRLNARPALAAQPWSWKGLRPPAQALANTIARTFEREPLLHGRTPLTFLPRLSAAIGVEVLVKRDDFGDLAVAGSKMRKIERIVAAARAAGCTTLVTAGPAQSNTARAVAVAASRAGLASRIFLRAPAGAPLEGNALIAHMVGAEIVPCGMAPWPQIEAMGRAEALADPRARWVPIGASDTAGVVGLAAGYLEMLEQLAEFDVQPSAIYHASASGGLWAGLALAAHATTGPRPHPVAVIGDVYDDMPARYASIYNGAAAALGLTQRIEPAQVCLDWRGLAYAPYGEPAPAVLDALALAARTEGLLAEYTYVGRALAVLIEDARAKRISGPVVLWHSGGLTSLMAADAQGVLAARSQSSPRVVAGALQRVQ